jgi:hypothetical protein
MTHKKISPLAKRVLDYLQRKGDASPSEAFLDLDQLSSGSFTRRITELREAGYMITDKWRVHPITKRTYKRYYFAAHD